MWYTSLFLPAKTMIKCRSAGGPLLLAKFSRDPAGPKMDINRLVFQNPLSPLTRPLTCCMVRRCQISCEAKFDKYPSWTWGNSRCETWQAKWASMSLSRVHVFSYWIGTLARCLSRCGEHPQVQTDIASTCLGEVWLSLTIFAKSVYDHDGCSNSSSPSFRTSPKMLGAKEMDKIQSLSLSYIICLVLVTPSGQSMLLYVLLPFFCCTD